MCVHLCCAFRQVNFWFQCKHVANVQYVYMNVSQYLVLFIYLNSLLFSSFRTWFIYIFFWDVMCGLHESKKIAAMLVFLNLTECIFVESSELPSGMNTGKTFFKDKFVNVKQRVITCKPELVHSRHLWLLVSWK